MGAFYIFFISLGGIVVLLSLKMWEINRGAKPFSVLRYRMDILLNKAGERIKYFLVFINLTTFRLILAFLVAKSSEVFSFLVAKVRESKVFRLVKGKLLPPEGGGHVSAFLRDVAEFKNKSPLEKSENSDKKE